MRLIDKIIWLGHASFKIKGDSKTIYIDPWKIASPSADADIILVGHSHYDHLSIPDVEKISKPTTVLVAPEDCANQLQGEVNIVKPGDVLNFEDVIVEAVPAYNPDKAFHPRANNWVGFIVTVDGERLYYASDTDIIPEMAEVRDIQVSLLPVGGTYTMGPKEAAQAAETIKPEIAVPYHYGDIVGSEEDARSFSTFFSGKTKILKPQKG